MLLVSQRLDSPRMDPILPGSLKRKLSGATESSPLVNGVSDTSMTQGSAKRPCLEDVTLAIGPSYSQPPFPSGPGVGNQGSVLEGNRINNSNNNGLGSPYSMPPKASPGPTPGGGGGSGSMAQSFNSKGNSNAPSVEQELQEILDELTKNPDPSLPELDIEKILGNKTDEQPSGPVDFIHPEGSGTPKRSPQRPSHLEAHLTRSPGFPQANSPQVGPSPGGAPYSLPHPSKPVPSPLSASPLSSSSQGQNQARSPMLSAALTNRPGSSWHEVSRAQKLQQMASNNKHHSSSGGPPPPPPPAQSGLPTLGQQTSSWAGPSPPYRPGDKLPNSSPHQQPFSPAGSIQSPQSSLISSMAPAPSTGPSPPYRPEKLASPALAQPPFSPQSTLLPGNASAGGSCVTNQGSQASYLPNVPPASGTTRPSPTYRPDKHPSPAGPPQQQTQPPPQTHSFGSQNGQATGMSSQLYKAITSAQPPSSSLKLLIQAQQAQVQGKPQVSMQSQLGKAAGNGSLGPEPFSFNNTKPLRHFDPDPSAPKLSSLSMGAYRNTSMQPTPPTSAAGHARLLQQRMQRGMQTGGMVPHCQELSNEQNSGMLPHLQDPTSVQRPAQGNSCNLLLKNQLMRKQLQQQEKQRQIEQMNGGQMPDCQQVAPFQGSARPLPPECGSYPMGGPQPNSSMLSHTGPLPPGRMGISPGTLPQTGHPTGTFMGNTGSKQPLYHPAQDFGMPMQPTQGMMGMGGPPRQPSHPGPGALRPGMPGPNLAGNSVPTHHLRQALHQGGAMPPRGMFTSQQQAQLWQHQQGVQPPHMDPSNNHHPFPGGSAPPGCGAPSSQFSQLPQRPGMPANFVTHQTPGTRLPPPNQVVAGMGARHIQRMPAAGQPLPSMGQQGLRLRGPLSALAVMKPGAPNMMHPPHGMAPPSYPTSSTGKHMLTQGYGPGHNPGHHKLSPFDFSPQHQANGTMVGVPRGPGEGGGGGGGGGEVDFIETLVGGSSEDWLNNLNMIDEYLEQNS
ncbi:mastermind-like domain-containing protein 1 [Chanos chanos]|uniref:Mastermind-like domain-containing protein 1 n=1 Tax=Chanos chanos TaxID=29144 RepID=A0A6J2VWQ4_CHACN|nr:mastermind-like domain-containing protein 1 [Chanos chanos]